MHPLQVSVLGAQVPEIIDAPLFLPGGQSILFSAPEPVQSYQPDLLERLMGVQVAHAHNVLSDWWSVPVSGGTPVQLTKNYTLNLFASLSPDRKYLASLSGEGLFVMGLDGSNFTQLIMDPNLHGRVSWIPQVQAH